VCKLINTRFWVEFAKKHQARTSAPSLIIISIVYLSGWQRKHHGYTLEVRSPQLTGSSYRKNRYRCRDIFNKLIAILTFEIPTKKRKPIYTDLKNRYRPSSSLTITHLKVIECMLNCGGLWQPRQAGCSITWHAGESRWLCRDTAMGWAR